MSIGSTVRRLFGPYERQVANAYRAMFVDLDEWVEQIGRWAPEPRRILEVGCGEGAMTERLRNRYPSARITAIDVTPRLGRLYRGDRSGVEFAQVPVETVARNEPQAFDLVLLSDVLHHVPPELRSGLLVGIREAMTRQGVFVFKDWLRTGTPIHWACAISDRYITGDKVEYPNAQEAKALIAAHFGRSAIRDEYRVGPWGNNLALLVRLGAE